MAAKDLIPHQFKPGQSGNPGGRPKRRLGNELEKLFDEKNIDRAFLLKGIEAAMKGDFRYWNAIFERIDGKVSDKSDDDKNLEESPAVDEAGQALEP